MSSEFVRFVFVVLTVASSAVLANGVATDSGWWALFGSFGMGVGLERVSRL